MTGGEFMSESSALAQPAVVADQGASSAQGGATAPAAKSKFLTLADNVAQAKGQQGAPPPAASDDVDPADGAFDELLGEESVTQQSKPPKQDADPEYDLGEEFGRVKSSQLKKLIGQHLKLQEDIDTVYQQAHQKIQKAEQSEQMVESFLQALKSNTLDAMERTATGLGLDFEKIAVNYLKRKHMPGEPIDSAFEVDPQLSDLQRENLRLKSEAEKTTKERARAERMAKVSRAAAVVEGELIGLLENQSMPRHKSIMQKVVDEAIELKLKGVPIKDFGLAIDRVKSKMAKEYQWVQSQFNDAQFENCLGIDGLKRAARIWSQKHRAANSLGVQSPAAINDAPSARSEPVKTYSSRSQFLSEIQNRS